MTLLLLQDIDGIGRKFQIITVDRELALEKLLPQRRALVATPGVRKRYADCIRKTALSA